MCDEPMFDYWYTLEWLFRLVHTNELSSSLCVSSHHLCRVMCTNEVGMSLEVVHTILSSQHVSRVVHANQVSMSLNTTPGADLDILFRGLTC